MRSGLPRDHGLQSAITGLQNPCYCHNLDISKTCTTSYSDMSAGIACRRIALHTFRGSVHGIQATLLLLMLLKEGALFPDMLTTRTSA